MTRRNYGQLVFGLHRRGRGQLRVTFVSLSLFCGCGQQAAVSPPPTTQSTSADAPARVATIDVALEACGETEVTSLEGTFRAVDPADQDFDGDAYVRPDRITLALDSGEVEFCFFDLTERTQSGFKAGALFRMEDEGADEELVSLTLESSGDDWNLHWEPYTPEFHQRGDLRLLSR